MSRTIRTTAPRPIRAPRTRDHRAADIRAALADHLDPAELDTIGRTFVGGVL